MEPLVSIVVPVYNAEKYLNEAVESILDQTYKNIELILINDGSQDKTEEIIISWLNLDKRIKYYKNEENKGIIYTLNKALNLAQGIYIARMDADDICLPNRIFEQVTFMEKNEEVALCSTYAFFFKNNNKLIKKKFGGYLNPEEIKVQLIFKDYILHPTVMFRKKIIEKYDLKYNALDKNVEDYGLWIKVAKVGKIATLPVIGLNYRCLSSSITSSETLKKIDQYKNNLKNLYNREFKDYFGTLSDEELDIHVEIATIGNLKGEYKYSVVQKEEYLKRILLQNEKIGSLNSDILREECKIRLRECIMYHGTYNNLLESEFFRGERFLFVKYHLNIFKKYITILYKKYLR